MSIAAANVAPAFHTRRSIAADDLRRLAEPALIFEGTHTDADGAIAWLYTVAGFLDGQNIATMQGGCTVGGDVIIVHARSRDEADLIAGMGFEDTINALRAEDDALIEAAAALGRLKSVNPIRRLDLATAPASSKNDEFISDVKAIERLRGDDIVLAAGGGVH